MFLSRRLVPCFGFHWGGTQRCSALGVEGRWYKEIRRGAVAEKGLTVDRGADADAPGAPCKSVRHVVGERLELVGPEPTAAQA